MVYNSVDGRGMWNILGWFGGERGEGRKERSGEERDEEEEECGNLNQPRKTSF